MSTQLDQYGNLRSLLQSSADSVTPQGRYGSLRSLIEQPARQPEPKEAERGILDSILGVVRGKGEAVAQSLSGNADERSNVVALQNQMRREALGRVEGPTGTGPADADNGLRMSEQSPVGAVAASLGRGVGQLVEGVGGSMRAAGRFLDPAAFAEQSGIARFEEPVVPLTEPLGRPISDVGRRIQNAEWLRPSTSVEEGGAFQPGNPRWWLERGAELVPQMAAQVGMGLVTGGAGPAAQLAAFALPSAVLEGGMAFNEVLEQTGDPNQAAEVAALTGAGATVLEQIPGAAILFNRIPGARQAFRSGLVQRAALVSTAEGVTEATQEAWADAMNAAVTQDPEAFADWQQRYMGAGALGALVGGAAGTAVRPQEVPEAPEKDGGSPRGGTGRPGPLPPRTDPLEVPAFMRRGPDRTEEIQRAAVDPDARERIEQGQHLATLVREAGTTPLHMDEAQGPVPTDADEGILGSVLSGGERKPPPAARSETEQEETAQPQRTLQPAVMVDREIYTGRDHGEAMEAAAAATGKSIDEIAEQSRGSDFLDLFVDDQGNILNRFSASAELGVTASENIPGAMRAEDSQERDAVPVDLEVPTPAPEAPAAGRKTYLSTKKTAEESTEEQLRQRYLRNVRLAFATGSEGAKTRQELDAAAFRDRTSRKSQFVDRGRSRALTTQGEARARAYEDEAEARGVKLPDPDEAFVDADPNDFPASVRVYYERAIEHLPDMKEIRSDELMDLLETLETEAANNPSDPVAQVKRAIVSGTAHSRDLFNDLVGAAGGKDAGIPFDPAEVQGGLFGGDEVVVGEEQRGLGIEGAPNTLERQERLARQAVDRLKPVVEGGKPTDRQREEYREALALLRRDQAQSEEEVRLRAQPREDGDIVEREGGDLFGDPGEQEIQRRRTERPRDPLSDPVPETEADVEASRFGDRLAGNMEAPAKPPEGGPVAVPNILSSLVKVTEAAGKALRIRQGRRGVPGDARGVFYPDQEVVRVRNANNIATATHEVGHAIEKLLFGWERGGPWVGRRGINRAMQNELVAIGKALYGDRTPNGGYKREGWAEFLRIWVTRTDLDGRKAEPAKRAPFVNRWFEDTFSKDFPEVRKALDNARALTDRWREQGSRQRAAASIVDPNSLRSRVKQATEGIRDFASVTNWIEMAQPLAELGKAAERELGRPLAPEADPFVTISALRTTHSARARHMVEEAMIDLYGNQVGDPLNAIRGLVKGKQEDFTIYLWAHRTLALAADPNGGRESGLSVADAQQIIAELEAPGFQLAAERVYAWNDGVLNYAAQASPTFKAVVDATRERDPGRYIPLKREFEELNRRWKGGGATTRSPVKRLKGSGRRILDPFQSMISKAESTIMQAHKRMVIDQILRLSAIPGMGDVIVEVPKDQQPVYAASMEDLIERINRQLFQQTGKLLQTTDAQGNVSPPKGDEAEVLEQLITFFSPVNDPVRQDGENPIIPLYDQGDVRWFEVPKELYETLASIDIYRLPKIVDLTLGVPARLFRAGTTGLRASFGLIVNPLRDVQTMYVNTQSSASAPRVFFEWLRSLSEVAVWRTTGKRTEWVDAFVRLGLEMAQPLGQDIRHTKRAANRLFQGRMMRTLDPHNWYDWFRDLMQTPESAPRIAEMRMVAKEIGWEPGQPMSLEQSLALMNAASQVTTDFKAAGRLSRIANQMVAFHNAGIQGPRAHVRAYKRNPVKFAARGLQMTAASLLLWWQFKDEEWWTQMDSREKYLYWHIPFDHPTTGEPELLRIPRAFEVGGIFAAMPEALADAAYRQDPERMGEWFETFVESSSPPLVAFREVGGVRVPVPENPLIETASEQLANRRFYFDTPIVPRGEQEVPLPEQFNEYTARLSIELGELFNASPRRIDHAMQGLFGPVSRDLVEVLGMGPNGVEREKEMADLPIVGRLFQRGGRFGTRPKSVDEMYEVAEEAIRKQHSTRNPESELERQLRLQLQDATKAVTAAFYVRQYTPEASRRERITRLAASLAEEATEAYRARRLNRERYSEMRKLLEGQKEDTKTLVRFRRRREEEGFRVPGGKTRVEAQEPTRR